jgi:hypothetical protein
MDMGLPESKHSKLTNRSQKDISILVPNSAVTSKQESLEEEDYSLPPDSKQSNEPNITINNAIYTN